MSIDEVDVAEILPVEEVEALWFFHEVNGETSPEGQKWTGWPVEKKIRKVVDFYYPGLEITDFKECVEQNTLLYLRGEELKNDYQLVVSTNQNPWALDNSWRYLAGKTCCQAIISIAKVIRWTNSYKFYALVEK